MTTQAKLSTAEEARRRVEEASADVSRARTALSQAEHDLAEAKRALYDVRFRDINAMELSHIIVECNGERLMSLDYGWAEGLSVGRAACYLVSELLREGSLVLASEERAKVEAHG